MGKKYKLNTENDDTFFLSLLFIHKQAGFKDVSQSVYLGISQNNKQSVEDK